MRQKTLFILLAVLFCLAESTSHGNNIEKPIEIANNASPTLPVLNSSIVHVNQTEVENTSTKAGLPIQSPAEAHSPPQNTEPVQSDTVEHGNIVETTSTKVVPSTQPPASSSHVTPSAPESILENNAAASNPLDLVPPADESTAKPTEPSTQGIARLSPENSFEETPLNTSNRENAAQTRNVSDKTDQKSPSTFANITGVPDQAEIMPPGSSANSESAASNSVKLSPAPTRPIDERDVEVPESAAPTITVPGTTKPPAVTEDVGKMRKAWNLAKRIFGFGESKPEESKPVIQSPNGAKTGNGKPSDETVGGDEDEDEPPESVSTTVSTTPYKEHFAAANDVQTTVILLHVTTTPPTVPTTTEIAKVTENPIVDVYCKNQCPEGYTVGETFCFRLVKEDITSVEMNEIDVGNNKQTLKRMLRNAGYTELYVNYFHSIQWEQINVDLNVRTPKWQKNEDLPKLHAIHKYCEHAKCDLNQIRNKPAVSQGSDKIILACSNTEGALTCKDNNLNMYTKLHPDKCTIKGPHCAGVNCTAFFLPIDNDTCPDDSYRPADYIPKGGCCPVKQACRCRTTICPVPSCLKTNERPILLKQGIGLPGRCCEEWKCVPTGTPSCNDYAIGYVSHYNCTILTCVKQGNKKPDFYGPYPPTKECTAHLDTCAQKDHFRTYCIGCQAGQKVIRIGEQLQNNNCKTCVCTPTGDTLCNTYSCHPPKVPCKQNEETMPENCCCDPVTTTPPNIPTTTEIANFDETFANVYCKRQCPDDYTVGETLCFRLVTFSRNSGYTVFNINYRTNDEFVLLNPNPSQRSGPPFPDTDWISYSLTSNKLLEFNVTLPSICILPKYCEHATYKPMKNSEMSQKWKEQRIFDATDLQCKSPNNMLRPDPDLVGCVMKDLHCANVDCNNFDLPPGDNDTCPKDSYRPAEYIPEGGCCPVKQACRCRTSVCPKPKCQNSEKILHFKLGQKEPGRCCDEWTCVKELPRNIVTEWILTCTFCLGCIDGKGANRSIGEVWQTTKNNCETCVCTPTGEVKCETFLCQSPKVACNNDGKTLQGTCCCDPPPTTIALPTTTPTTTTTIPTTPKLTSTPKPTTKITTTTVATTTSTQTTPTTTKSTTKTPTTTTRAQTKIPPIVIAKSTVEAETIQTTEGVVDRVTAAAVKDEKESDSGILILVLILVALALVVLLGAFIIWYRKRKQKKNKNKNKKTDKKQKKHKKKREDVETEQKVKKSETKNSDEKDKKKKKPAKVVKIRQMEAAPINKEEFKFKGPLKLSSGTHGSMRHAMDGKSDHSLKNPVEFDAELNEVVQIGTDIEVVEPSVSVSSKNGTEKTGEKTKSDKESKAKEVAE